MPSQGKWLFLAHGYLQRPRISSHGGKWFSYIRSALLLIVTPRECLSGAFFSFPQNLTLFWLLAPLFSTIALCQTLSSHHWKRIQPRASMSSNATYVGFWVDWSKGSTLGSTLTLPSRSGILLTAALALFVQFTGTHFWGIVTFTLHQMRSSPKPHDGLFYQQQAILRNSSAGDALTQLMKVTMAWTSKSTRRNLLLMLTATLHLVGFIVAGIFSSNVVIENPGVLIRGSSCGLWPSHLNLTQKVQVNFTEQVDFSKNYLENAMLSARDVKSCIPPNTTSLINPEDEHECDVSTGKVKWHVDLAAACPFAPEMCIGSRTGAVQLNSGHLDSDLDFGINAPPQSRVTYQKILTCAPINTKGFTSDEWTAGSNYSTDPTAGYLYFYYGPSQPYVYNSITAYAYTSWVSNHTALTYHTVAPTSQDVLYYLEFVHPSDIPQQLVYQLLTRFALVVSTILPGISLRSSS